MSISGTIELIVDETEVVVDYTYFPRERTTRHYPGCDADIDINSCVDVYGREREDIAEKLLKDSYLIERVEEDLSDAYNNRY